MKDRLESMPKGRLWPTFFFSIFFIYIFFLSSVSVCECVCVNEKHCELLFLPLNRSLVKT